MSLESLHLGSIRRWWRKPDLFRFSPKRCGQNQFIDACWDFFSLRFVNGFYKHSFQAWNDGEIWLGPQGQRSLRCLWRGRGLIQYIDELDMLRWMIISYQLLFTEHMLKYEIIIIADDNFESKQRNVAMVITLQEDADKLIVERKRERPQWFSRFGHTWIKWSRTENHHSYCRSQLERVREEPTGGYGTVRPSGLG